MVTDGLNGGKRKKLRDLEYSAPSIICPYSNS